MRLEARNLHKTFKTGPAPLKVLDGVDLELKPGETLGIIGASGSGKTTLAHILAGIAAPDQGQVRLGNLSLWPRTRPVDMVLRRLVQIVWQQPETAFNPRWKLGRSLREPYLIHGLAPNPGLIEAALAKVGLDGRVLERRPAQLSGGELQRLAIARAMSLGPAVIILDEPTSMLDSITQAQVIRLLEDLQLETGVAYIFISHNPELVERFSSRSLVLADGRLTGADAGPAPAFQGDQHA